MSQYRVNLCQQICTGPVIRFGLSPLGVGGIMGRCWREFLLPIYLGLGLGSYFKRDPSMPDDEIDVDYVADNLWLVGSPQTVADRILDLHDQTGGFGHLTIVSYNAADERESWERSLRLLINEVLPRCQGSRPYATEGAGAMP